MNAINPADLRPAGRLMPDGRDDFEAAFNAYRARFDAGPPLMLALLPRVQWVAWMRAAICRGQPVDRRIARRADIAT